jgi:hypothetical protein
VARDEDNERPTVPDAPERNRTSEAIRKISKALVILGQQPLSHDAERMIVKLIADAFNKGQIVSEQKMFAHEQRIRELEQRDREHSAHALEREREMRRLRTLLRVNGIEP